MGAPRKYLFIHQNFPGQFVHVAKELARQGHQVVALGVEARAPVPGVRCLRYKPAAPAQLSGARLVRDFESKVVRGAACAAAMQQLQRQGFVPDVVVAHPGWGEALFCKDVWPAARLVVFSEFYYQAEGADFGFDPEFSSADTPITRSRLRLKNTALMHALLAADVAYAPTEWQRAQVPAELRHKVQGCFDGIDTAVAAPDAQARFRLPGTERVFTREDEVLTFVNRSLEPYRGFHVFMRALPGILAARPQAQVVIVGRDGVSYGARPAGGKSWREVMLAEVGDRLPLERVHFVAALPYTDYVRMLQVSRCHVYLTYPFVLSWSCLEAMSVGCTVVASDTAPVREVMENDKTGLLVDFFDIEALQARVTGVLAEPERFAALGGRARAAVVARYDLASICLPRLLGLVDAHPSVA